MTKFRPCIDLHDGKVKQIVGGTLTDGVSDPVENYVSRQAAETYASMYAADNLPGGHIIKLGPGNDKAARAALAAYPGGMQIGGGITLENGCSWLNAGASHIVVTSWLFDTDGKFREDRCRQLQAEIGKQKIVFDLSCRKLKAGWQVAMNRWQTLTNLPLNLETLDLLADYADEFLIHAADVEGLCQGIDRELVKMLGVWGRAPVTYAGGTARLEDVQLVSEISGGRVDITVGSTLDIFGGSGVKYADLVAWNHTIPSN